MNTLTVWIVRDEQGSLKISTRSPLRNKDINCWYTETAINPDHPLGEGLIWESEPKKVELVEAGEEKILTKMIFLMAERLAKYSLREDHQLGFKPSTLEQETEIEIWAARHAAEEELAKKELEGEDG